MKCEDCGKKKGLVKVECVGVLCEPCWESIKKKYPKAKEL